MSADNGEERWRAFTPRTLDLAPPTAAPDSTHITYLTNILVLMSISHIK